MADALRPGARIGIGASLYLAVIWILILFAITLWLKSGMGDFEDPNEAVARLTSRAYLILRVGPLLLALGEAARAASAMMMLTAGDTRQRAVAHTGIVTTIALVALAIEPGPALAIIILIALLIRQAASGSLLKEPFAWLAAIAFLTVGIVGQGTKDDQPTTTAFVVACAVAALAELGHAWQTGRNRS